MWRRCGPRLSKLLRRCPRVRPRSWLRTRFRPWPFCGRRSRFRNRSRFRTARLCPRHWRRPRLRRASLVTNRRCRSRSCNFSGACRFRRSRHHRRARPAAIHLRKRISVSPRGFNPLLLNLCRRSMADVYSSLLHRRWRVTNPVRSAIESHAPLVRDRVRANDRLINVGLVNHRRIHARHRRVVGESPAAPLAANIAHTHVAVSIIDAPVVPDIIAPISLMEKVAAVLPCPPRRSPHRPHIRCWHPFSRNPVVPGILFPRPVSRNPHQSVLGAHWLFVHRKLRRRNGYADGNLCTGSYHAGTEQKRWQNPAHVSNQFHRRSSSDPRLSCKYATLMTSELDQLALCHPPKSDTSGSRKQRETVDQTIKLEPIQSKTVVPLLDRTLTATLRYL